MEGGSRPVGRPPGSANKPPVPNPPNKVVPKKPVTLGKGEKHIAAPAEGELIALGKGKKTGRLVASGEHKGLTQSLKEEAKKESQVQSSTNSNNSVPAKQNLQPQPVKRQLNEPSSLERKPKVQKGADLTSVLNDAKSTNDFSQLANAIHQNLFFLREHPADPDKQTINSMLQASKTKPELFESKDIFQLIVFFIRRNPNLAAIYKRNPQLPVMACTILNTVFMNKPEWPFEFVQAYIEDSLSERIWVDDEGTKTFVDNLSTGFSTEAMIKLEASRKAEPTSAPVPPVKKVETTFTPMVDGEEIEEEESGVVQSFAETSNVNLMQPVQPKEEIATVTIKNRYPDPVAREKIKHFLLDNINQQLHKQNENPKNVIRLLTQACGYREVRVRASEFLEEWLNNPAMMRWAKELLQKLAQTCQENSPEDLHTVMNILKLRVKPVHGQLITESIYQLLKNNVEYPVVALRHFIFNEVLPGKSAINIKLLHSIFKSMTKKPEDELALIFQDLAANENSRPQLKLFVRKIIKLFPHTDIDFVSLCKGVMNERSDILAQDVPIRISWISSLVELLCALQMLSIPPAFYEGNLTTVQNSSVVGDFRQNIAKIQMEATRWFHVIVPKYSGTSQYTQLLKRVLFVDTSNPYFAGEMPPEMEKNVLRFLNSNIPVHEDTVTRLVLISITKLPLSSPDALDILETLLKRAGTMTDKNAIVIGNGQLVEAILKLSLYSPPNISETDLHKFPQFAVINWFWQACILLVILSAFNPSTAGKLVWGMSTIKIMLEMVITRNYTFPPVSSPGRTEEQIHSADAQLHRIEKEQIVELEHLIATTTDPNASINMDNSILVTQLIMYNISGPARHPPSSILKKLQSIDAELRLGHKLCISRNPDFLLDIMNRQGAQKSLVWLGPIIQSEPDTLDALPIVCLCELLFISYSEANNSFNQLQRLLNRLTQYLTASSLSANTIEILDFFLSKLSSSKLHVRETSKKSLGTLLVTFLNQNNSSDTMNIDSAPGATAWLDKLTSLPHYKDSQPTIVTHLTNSLQKETNEQAIHSYIQYLYINSVDIPSLAIELSKLLVDRKLIVSQLLRNFDTYGVLLKLFTKAVTNANALLSRPLEIVTIQVESAPEFRIPKLILQGIIELLAVPKPPSTDDDENVTFMAIYEQLVNRFFPRNKTVNLCDSKKQVFPLLDSEQSLKFARTQNLQLVEAGTSRLHPNQIAMILCTYGLPQPNIDILLRRLDSLIDQIDPKFKPQLKTRIELYINSGSKASPKILQSLNIAPRNAPEKMEVTTTNQPVNSSRFSESEFVNTLSAFFTSNGINEKLLGKVVTHVTQLVVDSSLSQSNSLTNFIQRLNESITGTQGTLNFNKLKSQSQLSVSLLELLLLHNQRKPNQSISQLSQALYKYSQADRDISNGLVTYVKNKYSKEEKVKHDNRISRLWKEVSGNDGLVSKDQFVDFVDKTVNSQVSVSVKHQTHEMIEHLFIKMITGSKNRSSMIEYLLGALSLVHSKIKNPIEKSCYSGIFYDWLSILDFQNSSPLVLSQIFQSNRSLCSGHAAYFISTLLHHSDWKDLRNCFRMLIGKQSLEKMDFLVSLNFITTYLRHPKSWTGHVNEELTVATPTLHDFTSESIQTFSDYVIGAWKEIRQIRKNEDLELYFKPTITMLLSAARQNRNGLNSLANYLSTQINSESNSDSPAHSLLLQVYLAYPSVVNSVFGYNSPIISQLTQKANSLSISMSSQLDLVLHALVRKLMDSGTSKSAYSLFRKIAVTHPLLVVRYLPNVNAILQGRVSRNVDEFVELQYHRLFLHVLGILDILRPLVFQQGQVLTNILDLYFDLLAAVRLFNKHIAGLVSKLVDFLCHYGFSIDDVSYLAKQQKLLSNTALTFPDIKKINLLLTIIANKGNLSTSVTVLPLGANEIELHRENLRSPLLALDSLKDLDKATQKAPILLRQFVEEFLSLSTVHNGEIRALAYKLILRFLNCFPRESDQIITSYIELLSNQQLRATALEYAVELFQFSQGHAQEFLSQLFAMGQMSVSQMTKIVLDLIESTPTKNV